MLTLKVCGLRTGDDLSFTAHPQVSHVGFIFESASKRYVTPEEVCAMQAEIHQSCVSMGIFVNQTLADMQAVIRTAGIKGVQLHGNESPETCLALKRQEHIVWKSFSVPRLGVPVSELLVQMKLYADVVDAVLLDAAPPKTADPSVPGGHGYTFDWGDLPAIMDSWHDDASLPPIWIAGGIHSHNLPALLNIAIPYGVDVSSGVETQGRKDLQKIHEMIEAVSNYNVRISG
jgi:phosphoribosylanthranilate isomerase